MRILSLLALLACSPADDADDTGVTAQDSGSGPDLTGLQPYTGGTCPSFTSGHQDFMSGGDLRDIRIELPPDPNGAPIVFAWHWLGGNADQIVEFTGFDQWPDDHGVILVSPQSRGLQVEWDSWAGPDNPDAVLFDDLLTCLVTQFDADRDRVYATGMSAGGLWTVTLTHQRAEYLAATAPLSGGATQQTWAPAAPTPMLLTWGGSGDTYGTYNFEDGTLDLAAQLDANGQFHAHCVHSAGHTLPPGGTDYVWEFFAAHPMGADAPWSGGLPASMPEMCTLP